MLAASVILLAGTVWRLFGVLAEKTAEETEILYRYNITADSRYEMHLIENELYPEGVLGENRTYSKRLIDCLYIEFEAGYYSSQPGDISGSYSVDVIVQGYQNTSQGREIIYERRFPLTENKPINGEVSAKVSEDAAIDIALYEKYAETAERILGTKVGCEAKIIFSGTFITQTEHGEVNIPFNYTIQIPLIVEMFTITKQASLSKSDVISEIREIIIEPVPKMIVLSVLYVLADIVLIIVLVFFVRTPDAEEQYSLHFKGIKRRYGSRIVWISTPPCITDGRQVVVADLESLIKVSDEIRQPICCFLDDKGLPENRLLFVPDDGKYYLLYLKGHIPEVV